MVFSKDDLYCDIFAPVLFIQWIFIGPCELKDISLVLFSIHYWRCCETLCLLCFKISELVSICF